MGAKNINGGNGLSIQGLVEIRLVNKKNHTTRVYHNTITNAGKQFLLCKSAGRMLSIGADTFGCMMSTNMLTKIGYGDSVRHYRVAHSDRDITNVLLNLGEEANSLSADSTFINIWDNNLENRSKLVGYANSNITPNANGLEGSIDYCKGEYIIDPFAVSMRWKYPEGVASGTIDTIAMMPASVVKTNMGDGISIGKCIDRVNTQYANYVSMSTGFLIPGVPGYTANDEILLNFNQDGCSRWKFNLTTGNITQVPESDNFFVLPYSGSDEPYKLTDVKVIGNYLYALGPNYNTTTYSACVVVYDISNNMNKVASINCIAKDQIGSNNNVKFLMIDNELYVTSWRVDLIKNSYSNGKLWKLTSNGNYYNGVGSAQADYSSIGFNCPSGVNLEYIGLGNYKDNYVMFISCKYTDTSGNDIDNFRYNYMSMGYVFSDLSNPMGSLIDVISGIPLGGILFSAGNNSGMLKIGNSYYTSTRYYGGTTYDCDDYAKCCINNSNKDFDVVTNMENSGVIYIPDKSWTNVFSFVKLNTPIVKTDDDIMYVSYIYKVV